jgi:hypothetical protein
MSEFTLPVLGFDNSPRPRTIMWADGTPVGILDLAFDPVASARYEAEQTRNEQIRQSENVVLLDDWRRK